MADGLARWRCTAAMPEPDYNARPHPGGYTGQDPLTGITVVCRTESDVRWTLRGFREQAVNGAAGDLSRRALQRLRETGRRG